MASRIQIEVVATFLIFFGAHMNLLFINKVKIFVLIEWSYMFPQLCLLLNLEWLVHILRLTYTVNTWIEVSNLLGPLTLHATF
jgi:hypothetical protein